MMMLPNTPTTKFRVVLDTDFEGSPPEGFIIADGFDTEKTAQEWANKWDWPHVGEAPLHLEPYED